MVVFFQQTGYLLPVSFLCFASDTPGGPNGARLRPFSSFSNLRARAATWTRTTRDRWRRRKRMTRTTTDFTRVTTGKNSKRPAIRRRRRTRKKPSAYRICAMTSSCTYLNICRTIVSPTCHGEYAHKRLDAGSIYQSLLFSEYILRCPESATTGRYGNACVSKCSTRPWKTHT